VCVCMSYLHLRSVEARVHGLRAVVVVPRRAKLFAEVIDRTVLVRESEGGAVLYAQEQYTTRVRV